VRNLSICPFWSTKKEKVSCYNTCPLYSEEVGHEICPFREFLSNNNELKNNDALLFGLEDEYYSQSEYLNFTSSEKVINY